MTTLSPSPGFAGGLPLIWNPGLYSQEHSCPSEGLFLRTSEALPLRGEPTSNGNGNNSDLSDSDSDSTDTSIGELVGSTGRRRRGLSELATRDTST